MKKVILLIFIASLSGLIASCSLFGNQTDNAATTEETPTPTASPSPSPTQPFAQAPQAGTGSSGNTDIGGLIPSTPPSEIPVEKGRSDPFALVPVKPIITVDPTQITTTPAPATPPAPPSTSGSSTANPPKTVANPPKPSARNSGNPPRPSASPKTASTPTTPNPSGVPPAVKPSQAQPPIAQAPIAPPPPPQPTEAEAVLVSGVVGLPTRPVAIIKAPGEQVERTVTPGSFLANGQVLVKAIYANSDNPVVILEQYGIEVAKKVGEAPVQANASENPDNG